MKILHFISTLFSQIRKPIEKNFSFFFFMYLLGIIVSYIELPKHKPTVQVYENLWIELFFDLYLLSVILLLLPKKVKSYTTTLLCSIAYIVAFVDVFCWTKFQSTLNPSILLLVLETNSREANEFLNSYFSIDMLFSPLGVVFLICFIHIIYTFTKKHLQPIKYKIRSLLLPHKKLYRSVKDIIGFFIFRILIYSASVSFYNKQEIAELFSQKTIGAVEHELTTAKCAELYQPIYRLVFSIHANRLAAQQIDRLIEAKNSAKVDGCDFTSRNIVLIIGESMGRHHSQQYGYFMPTTPMQIKHEKQGNLIPFTDVVAPWNLTSFVFKNTFSVHTIGEKGEWCDYPLFPQLFRKAGYNVSFITNQFLSKAKEAVYDFSGGFFLNHSELSASMFDNRNNKLHTYDAGLLDEYDKNLKTKNKENNLIIFHLMGQHVSYKLRYPKHQKHFTAEDYKEKRPNLNLKERTMLAHYDNAMLYNDSIVDQIIKRFEHEEAIVIYMPDHGEECYEEDRGFICRNHSAEIDYKLAHYEFEIPFWIYCSKTYMSKNPHIVEQIKAARNKPFMTDALPHLLLYLGGIKTKAYQPKFNILHKEYYQDRPRLLKQKTDYNILISNHRQKN